MNIAKKLEENAKTNPNRVALIFENNSFSYKELNDRSNQITNYLKSLGISSGDRVALLLPNIPSFITFYFAIHKLGAIAVTINSTLKSQEIEFILKNSEAKVVVTLSNLSNQIDITTLPSLEETIIIEGEKQKKSDILLDDLIKDSSPIAQAIELKENTPAVMLYTSGTTGFPKGVLLSHQNIVSNTENTINAIDIEPNDKSLLFLPIFHSYVQFIILNSTLSVGATLVLEREFEMESILNSIQKHQVTLFFAVPTIYNILSDYTLPNRLSSLKKCISAGASLPLEVSEKWHKKFKLIINELYGLTECSMVCFNDSSKINSVGRAVNNTEIKIVDDLNNSVPKGALGEIVVKGSSVMLGYWKQPTQTDNIIKEEWFYTGDIGKLDEEGYLTIVDRKKEMINVGGQNVYPSEVEKILYSHQAVLEVAVYGISEPILGEQVCANIVLNSSQSITENEIIDFCRQSLAHYKLPSVVKFVKSLPKSRTGKILKKVLQDDYKKESNSLEENSLWQEMNRENRIIFLKKLCQNEIRNLIGFVPDEKQDFFSMGMDSLMSIQLSNKLSKKLSISLIPTLALEYHTIDKLYNHLLDMIDEPNDTNNSNLPISLDIYNWFPQSYIQQLYYRWNEEAENKSFMNLPFIMRVSSFIDSEVLETSLQMLIDRHSSLRLIYDTFDNIPMQKVQKSQKASLELKTVDCKNWDEVQDDIIRATKELFNLQEGPVLRAHLFSRNEKDHILLIVMHHIVADATAQSVLIDELFTLYNSNKVNAPISLETTNAYLEFIEWSKTMIHQSKGLKSFDYWHKQLSGNIELLNLPTDYPRRVKNRHYGDFYSFELSSKLTKDLQQLAKNETVTLYALMLTIYKLLLYFYTEQNDILIDTNMLNRPQSRFSKTVGKFSTILTIRTSISKNMNFKELLKEVQKTLWKALEHQSYPLELLKEKLNRPTGPVYTQFSQVWFNLLPLRIFQSSHPLFDPTNKERITIGDITLEPTNILPEWLGSWYEIETQLIETEDKILGYTKYDTDLYNKTTIKQFIYNYESLLEKIVNNPEKPISSFSTFIKEKND